MIDASYAFCMSNSAPKPVSEYELAPGLEVVDPATYLKMMDQALAGRDPLEVASQTPSVLRRLIDANPVKVLRSRPYTNRVTWTPLEVIGHMLDVEWTLGWRTRTVLCDDEPVITGMDQNKWVAVQKHNDRDPADLVADFSALRAVNLGLWSRITPQQHTRIGQHAERGEESLGGMLRFYAGHDVHHLAQIDKYLAEQSHG